MLYWGGDSAEPGDRLERSLKLILVGEMAEGQEEGRKEETTEEI